MKSLLHPNRCDNGCHLFDRRKDLFQIGIGYCRVHGGETVVSQAQYRFLSCRGCCSFGCGDIGNMKLLCESAAWIDGYFLCNSRDKCEFQEGAGSTVYCGRSDAQKKKEELKELLY